MGSALVKIFEILIWLQAALSSDPEFDGRPLSEAEFRWRLACDGPANDKLAAGMRSFAGDTARLVGILESHPLWR